MLPPALCDGLCSLRPDEDRLAMLAEIPFSVTGQPGRPRFAAVVMRSAARLTYDQVKACLLDRDEQARAALAAGPRGQEVLDMLETADRTGYRCAWRSAAPGQPGFRPAGTGIRHGDKAVRCACPAVCAMMRTASSKNS